MCLIFAAVALRQAGLLLYTGETVSQWRHHTWELKESNLKLWDVSKFVSYNNPDTENLVQKAG